MFSRVLLLGIVSISSCQVSAAITQQGKTAWEKVQEGSLFIDVRSKREYTAKHLPNAFNVPLNRLATVAAKLPKELHFVIYSGADDGLSYRGFQYMKKSGFASVFDGGSMKDIFDSSPRRATEEDSKKVEQFISEHRDMNDVNHLFK